MSSTTQPPPRDVRAEIDALLAEADGQITAVSAMYESSLQKKDVPLPLQAKITGAVVTQRSALEYLATAITERYGKQGRRTYYPYCPDPTKWVGRFEAGMPGVAASCPDIRDAIERHQLFPSKPQWLDHLVKLKNQNHHRQFSPQTRDETRWIEMHTPGGGGVGFTPFQPGKGGVAFGGQVSMGGVPVDPRTLVPLGGGPKPYTETIYVDWLFTEVGLSVRGVLNEIQAGVRVAVDDVCHVAGL